MIALTAACGYLEGLDDDEWARLAIMPDPNLESPCVNLQTTFHIMQQHYSTHAPLIPDITARRLIHENVDDRLDIVTIRGTGDEFELKKKKRQPMKKKNKDDFTKVFESMKFETVKKEPDKDKDLDDDVVTSSGHELTQSALPPHTHTPHANPNR